MFVYIDDVLMFSKSLEEHIQHVRAVLWSLLEHSFFVKAEKCELARKFASLRGTFLFESKKVCGSLPDPEGHQFDGSEAVASEVQGGPLFKCPG